MKELPKVYDPGTVEKEYMKCGSRMAASRAS